MTSLNISSHLFQTLGPMVPPDGPLDAKIVVVGEAPGSDEVTSGKPFTGGSGQLLEKAFLANRITRGQLYLTNICKQRPSGNDFATFYDDGERRNIPSSYLRESIDLLHSELSRLRPNVIIPVGDEPLRAVTGLRGISKWRGSILSSRFGKCVPTLHPAYILRQFQDHPLFYSDIKRGVQQSKFPEIRKPDYRFIVNPTLSQVFEWFDRLETRLVGGLETRVSFDIETLGSDIRCLGLGFETDVALCIPFIKFVTETPTGNGFGPGSTLIPIVAMAGTGRYGSYWTVEEEWEILKRLDQMFADPRIRLVAQNEPFDTVLLQRTFGFTFANLWMDTLMGQHTAYAEMPKGLDVLASLYTEIPYYSDFSASDDTQTFIYNCWDVVATWQVSYEIEKNLIGLDLGEFYWNHVNYLTEAVISIENRGCKYDTENALRTKEVFEAKHADLLNEIRKISGEPPPGKNGKPREFNPGSFPQMQWFFYEKLGLKKQYHHKTKELTTDKNAINKLMRLYPQHRDIFNLLKKDSETRTLVNSFLNRGWSDDGRMRTHFNSGGTVTRRLASSEPLFGDGSNLQNIPRRTTDGKLIRKLFIADEGWWICKCDLSQAEFRLVAWLAKIGHIIKKYADNPNWDVHCWVASMIFNKPESEITGSERDLAKNGVYGGNYRMQPERASIVYNLSVFDSRFVLNGYHKAIPEIPQWWSSVEQTIRTTRCIIQPTGGKRFFLGHFNTDTYLAGYSASAQTIVSDIINRAMVLAEELFDPRKFHILLQVHDELVFHIRKDCLAEAAHSIRRIMEVPLRFPDISDPLIIPADLSYGPNWQDQTKFNYKDNPYVFPSQRLSPSCH